MTITPSGQIFVRGKLVSIQSAAEYITALAGSDVAKAREVLGAALRGAPFAIS